MDKQSIREAVWDDLADAGVARFPFPPHGRIPNFAGADAAADRLTATPEWAEATTVKANPDAPQRPVRNRALAAGKTVFVAVPRLRERKPFRRLDPATIDDIDDATTLDGTREHGDLVDAEAMPSIELIVSGAVAVDDRGVRVGKGEGYSDLEYAILHENGLVGDTTPTATTVHPRQRWSDPIPPDPHDVPMGLICTPNGCVRPDDPPSRPQGIDWEAIDADRVDAIPVLQAIETST